MFKIFKKEIREYVGIGRKKQLFHGSAIKFLITVF